jgi:hypothetical protein
MLPNMQALRHFFDDIRSNAVTGIEWTKDQIDGLVADLHSVGTVTTVEDAQSLITYAVQMRTADGVDDRKMRQEQLMSWLYSLPQSPKSEVGTKLERIVIQYVHRIIHDNVSDFLKHVLLSRCFEAILFLKSAES